MPGGWLVLCGLALAGGPSADEAGTSADEVDDPWQVIPRRWLAAGVGSTRYENHDPYQESLRLGPDWGLDAGAVNRLGVGGAAHLLLPAPRREHGRIQTGFIRGHAPWERRLHAALLLGPRLERRGPRGRISSRLRIGLEAHAGLAIREDVLRERQALDPQDRSAGERVVVVDRKAELVPIFGASLDLSLPLTPGLAVQLRAAPFVMPEWYGGLPRFGETAERHTVGLPVLGAVVWERRRDETPAPAKTPEPARVPSPAPYQPDLARQSLALVAGVTVPYDNSVLDDYYPPVSVTGARLWSAGWGLQAGLHVLPWSRGPRTHASGRLAWDGLGAATVGPRYEIDAGQRGYAHDVRFGVGVGLGPFVRQARAFDFDRQPGSTTVFVRPLARACLDLDLPLGTGHPLSFRLSTVPWFAFGGGRIHLEQPASRPYPQHMYGVSVQAGFVIDRKER